MILDQKSMIKYAFCSIYPASNHQIVKEQPFRKREYDTF